MTKDSTALSNSLSLVHEAKVVSDRYPSEADDVGGFRRSSIQILQRSLNNLVSKNQEISASMAAFCLLGMPSTMHSRKFWYTFIRPAVAMQKQNFPAETTLLDGVAGGGVAAEEKDDSNDSDDSDVDRDTSGSGDQASRGSADSDAKDEQPNIIREQEDYVLEFSGADQGGEPPDGEGVAELHRHREGGGVVCVEQHHHYQHRGPQLRDLNFDEYCVLIVVTPVRQNAGAASAPGEAEAAEQKDDVDGDSDGSDDDEDEPLSAASAPRRRRSQGARTRNAVFDFTADHPLYLSHVQRLRSDPHIGILGGRSPPPFPGPRVGNGTPVWRRAAQAFAEYMVTLLCSWNPVTFHPERFDRDRGVWVDVPLNWDGLCDWVEDLHDREKSLRDAADAASVQLGSPQVVAESPIENLA